MKRAIGIGAGGHAQVLLEILLAQKTVEVIGLLDADPESWGKKFGGVAVLGGDDMLNEMRARGVESVFIGIGSAGPTKVRQAIYRRAHGAGFEALSVIHPHASIAPSSRHGAGAAILARAVVNSHAQLGDNVIVNTAAVVEHHCVIGDHCHIATGAVLAGQVEVGVGTHIGIGAVIRQGIRIGTDAVIGAGAVVVDDVADGQRVARYSRTPSSVKKYASIEEVSIAPSATIRQAAECLNKNRRGIVLVLDDDRRLLGTVTDGDIRRGGLAGIDFNSEVSTLMVNRPPTAKPITAPIGSTSSQLLHLMKERSVHQVPLLDTDGRAVGLVVMDDLIDVVDTPVRAVVMAGGFGKRLLPLTDDTPKPMLHVGDKPILERIVHQLRDAGVHHVSMTTHFKPEVIQQHFGDGRDFGIDIQYVQENEPLGTAGALGLVEEQQDPLLVINGDILTDVNFRAMIAYHREHRADITVAVRKYDIKIPYGVVQSDGVHVTGLQEKPELTYFVNAGIYLLEPGVHAHIPEGKRFDMTDLISRLLSLGRPVVSFPVVEYWLDIGRHADYERAQEDVKSGKLSDI